VEEGTAPCRFFSRLASFSRLILFDKRGTGRSDRDVGPARLEERMTDVGHPTMTSSDPCWRSGCPLPGRGAAEPIGVVRAALDRAPKRRRQASLPDRQINGPSPPRSRSDHAEAGCAARPHDSTSRARPHSN